MENRKFLTDRVIQGKIKDAMSRKETWLKVVIIVLGWDDWRKDGFSKERQR